MRDLLREGSREEIRDRLASLRHQHARAGSSEVHMLDHRFVAAGPGHPGRSVAVPLEPAAAFLVVDEEWLVTELGELGAPARAAAHGLIGLKRADHVDLLAGVDLI